MISTSLDYNKHNCNKCRSTITVAGHVMHEGLEAYGYARMKCKSYLCPECGPIKAKKLQKAIEEKARDFDLTRFLTLTLNPKTIPKDVDDIAYIREIWRKFRVYLQRRYGKSISYITVLEFHQSGIPHLHVLVNRYIFQGWISKTWETLGGGRIVCIFR